MLYEYKNNIFQDIIELNNTNFYDLNNTIEDNLLPDGSKITETYLKRLWTDIFKNRLYIIMVNPSNNLTFICYEVDDNLTFFSIYDRSIEVLRKYNKTYNRIPYQLLNKYPFEYTINHIPFYKEKSKISDYILLKDNKTIFNNKTLEFIDKSDVLPSYESDISVNNNNTEKFELLENIFNNMYLHENDLISFYAYILCLFNKSKIKQSIFINIDKSGTGKSSKILPLVLLGLNKIVDSRLLKKSELYNIANSNAIICNEIQNKQIDSSNLNNLADNMPLTVTRKSDFSIEIKGNEKPLIILMGENMPLLEDLSNGSNRRFYLVPIVSDSFMQFMNKDYNTEILKEFFTILNDDPYTVIMYYVSKIKKYNLFDRKIFEDAINNMKTDYKALTNLIISEDRIFNKYFVKYPLSKDDLTSDYYCIGINQSLNFLLEYIEDNEFDSNKLLDVNDRKKHLFKWIKDNNELRNIKGLGYTRMSKNNNTDYLYYSVALTEYGYHATKKINHDLLIKNVYF